MTGQRDAPARAPGAPEVDLLAVLARVGQAITASLEFEHIFAAIEQHVGSLLDTTTLYIGLLDDTGAWLDVPLFVDGGRRTESRRFHIDDPERRACQAVREGREIVKAATPEEARQRDLPGTTVTLSGLFNPLVVQGRTIGVMSVQSPRPHAYGERERRIFRTLCAFAAVALSNAENVRRLTALESLEELGRIQRALAASLDRRDILAALEQQLGRLLDVRGFRVGLLDPAGEHLSYPVSLDRGERVPAEPEPMTATGSPDVEAVRGRRETTSRLSGVTGLHGPLLRGRSALGLLAVWTDRPDGFAEREVLLFRSLCASLAAALANAASFAATEAARIEADETLARLRQAQADLIRTARLASLGGLVAGVAHEINTPIGTALTVATSLPRIATDFADRLGGTLRRSDLVGFAGAVGEAGRQLTANLTRAGELIDRFRQVAADRASDRERRFDLADLVAATLGSLAPQLRGVPHRLEVATPPGLACDTVPGAVGQILAHLVLNAVEHAFPDGAAGTIRIEARRSDGLIALSVEDDGAGMGEDVLARVFEPFFTTRRGHGSVGLGLHVAHNIAAQTLHGRLAARSVPGRGSAFELLFPSRRPETGRASPDPAVLAAEPSRNHRPADV